MALEYLTGIENELGKARKKAKKTKAEKKEKRKKVFKKVAKVALAPARAAFLAIVNLNALKIANKLAKLYKADQQKLINFWTKLGGKMEALKKGIEKGSKATLSGSGEMGFAIETAIATATPILIAIQQILKDMKITSPTEESELEKAIEEGKELLEKNPDVEKGSAEMDSDKDVGITKGEGESEGGAFGLSTPVLLGIGGAVLVGGYFLLKKKKVN